ncbi:MAG: thioesterase family protein [Pseudomonadota bacterium]
MFEVTRDIEWGECDALGIVFYPSFFKWMDAAFHAFTRSEGFDQASLSRDHQICGTPLVDAGCTFLSPGRYYEPLTIAVSVTKLGRSSVSLAYSFHIGETAIAEGRETRAFVKSDEDGLRKAEIPGDIRNRLERHVGQTSA